MHRLGSSSLFGTSSSLPSAREETAIKQVELTGPSTGSVGAPSAELTSHCAEVLNSVRALSASTTAPGVILESLPQLWSLYQRTDGLIQQWHILKGEPTAADPTGERFWLLQLHDTLLKTVVVTQVDALAGELRANGAGAWGFRQILAQMNSFISLGAISPALGHAYVETQLSSGTVLSALNAALREGPMRSILSRDTALFLAIAAHSNKSAKLQEQGNVVLQQLIDNTFTATPVSEAIHHRCSAMAFEHLIKGSAPDAHTSIFERFAASVGPSAHSLGGRLLFVECCSASPAETSLHAATVAWRNIMDEITLASKAVAVSTLQTAMSVGSHLVKALAKASAARRALQASQDVDTITLLLLQRALDHSTKAEAIESWMTRCRLVGEAIRDQNQHHLVPSFVAATTGAALDMSKTFDPKMEPSKLLCFQDIVLGLTAAIEGYGSLADRLRRSIEKHPEGKHPLRMHLTVPTEDVVLRGGTRPTHPNAAKNALALRITSGVETGGKSSDDEVDVRSIESISEAEFNAVLSTVAEVTMLPQPPSSELAFVYDAAVAIAIRSGSTYAVSNLIRDFAKAGVKVSSNSALALCNAKAAWRAVNELASIRGTVGENYDTSPTGEVWKSVSPASYLAVPRS
jgi:hypothetical protein